MGIFRRLVAKKLSRVVIAIPKDVYMRALIRIASEGLLHLEEPSRSLPGKPSPRFREAFTKASEKVSKALTYMEAIGLKPEFRKVSIAVRGDCLAAFSRTLSEYEKYEARFDALAQEVSALGGAHAVESSQLPRGIVEKLYEYYTVMYAFRELFRMLAHGVESSTFFFVEGYVDDEELPKLTRILDEETGGAYAIVRMRWGRGHVVEATPVKLELPPIISSFHEITRMYGEPRPGEIVPTIFLAVTFPVAFALMFPDAGHGLVLVLLGLLFSRRSKVWRDIFVVVGLAAFISGLLAGEFFGPLGGHLLEKLFGWISPIPPLALPTYAIEKGLGSEVVFDLLIGVIVRGLWFGAFMLSFGSLLGVLNAWLSESIYELLGFRLPKFLLFSSIALAVFTVPLAPHLATLVVALAAGGALVAIAWLFFLAPVIGVLSGHEVGESIVEGVMEGFDTIIMAMGNLPSFLRIVALALAHSVIMLSFTFIYHTLAEFGLFGSIAGLILYVGGNVIALAIEGIIVFAHAIRLHFYEWFSKFYYGGGLPFTPVSTPPVFAIEESSQD
ncbi:MAG: V-type ATPase 116kDa subunit family protein [Acidilobaceae archaeon]